MKYISRQTKAANIAEIFKERNTYYDGKWYGLDSQRTYEKLKELGPNPTPELALTIVGESWLKTYCHECDSDVEEVIHLGEEPGIDSTYFFICKDCFEDAFRLMAEHE